MYKSLLLSINVLSASTVWAQSPAQPKLSVHWEELSAAEFAGGIARAQGTCLLPFGILEKHGPHLALGNDLLNVRYAALNATDEMARNRCKKIIIVNGHGGNNSLLPYFAQTQLDTPQ